MPRAPARAVSNFESVAYYSSTFAICSTIYLVSEIPLEYAQGLRLASQGGEQSRRAPRDGKTVFIIGAGASSEVNLPVGSELKRAIAQRLDIRFENGLRQMSGDFMVLEAMRIAAQAEEPPSRDVNPYLHVGWRIRDALPQAISIDNLLDVHSGDKRFEKCAKFAIVRAILDAEQKSDLHINRPKGQKQLPYSRLEATWFNRFWQRLTENCRVSDLPRRLSSLALVVFNYDRCIEQFLYHSLQNYYGTDSAEAASLMQHLEIYHPYGTVGALPWLGGADTVAFGETPTPSQVVSLAARIKTFTEGTDESSSQISAIRSNIDGASRLVFLGFAFHRMNLDLLMPVPSPVQSSNGGRIYGTAHGISYSDVKDITYDLAVRTQIHPNDVQINSSLRCADLFYEFGRSVSLA